MSEKRKPDLRLIARGVGNGKRAFRIRLELFRAGQFCWSKKMRNQGAGQYRVRVNGKWYPPTVPRFTMNLTEFFNLLRRSCFK
jgi:hypothetical protein